MLKVQIHDRYKPIKRYKWNKDYLKISTKTGIKFLMGLVWIYKINLILNTNKSKIKYIYVRLGIDKTRIILK